MKYKFLFWILLFVFNFKLFSQKKLITPTYLRKGDTVAIVAPAGILKLSRKPTIDKTKELLESWGLHVFIGKNVFSQNNHFAGTDQERASDFQEALDNSSVKAIIAARGGYGSVRVLDTLNFSTFEEWPKWIVGYSDITAFHNHVHKLGIETLHAMMATSLEQDSKEIESTISTTKKALFGEDIKYKISSSQFNRTGKVEGQLIGGNLALMVSMLGSKSQLNTDGKILFIEEIGEYKYAIDRMLWSLKRAGYFKNLKGVIIGDMSLIKKNTTNWGSSIEELILDVLPKNIPVLFDFPAGHEADNRALLMGRKVTLTVKKEKPSSVIFKH